MSKQAVTILLIAFLLSSCVAGTVEKSAVSGAALGAVAGQTLGHNSKSTLIGAVAGATAGAAIGYLFNSAMNKSDQKLLSNTYEYNADGQTSKWINPDSGNIFNATPKVSYVDKTTGLDCRKAEIISNVEGQIRRTTTTACRENGVWIFK